MPFDFWLYTHSCGDVFELENQPSLRDTWAAWQHWNNSITIEIIYHWLHPVIPDVPHVLYLGVYINSFCLMAYDSFMCSYTTLMLHCVWDVFSLKVWDVFNVFTWFVNCTAENNLTYILNIIMFACVESLCVSGHARFPPVSPNTSIPPKSAAVSTHS